MPPSRYVRLTDEEDERLRQIEQDAYLNPKVRLRAQVLRLSARGESAERITLYTARSKASTCATSTASSSGVSRDWPMGVLRAERRVSPKRRGLSCGRSSRRRIARGTPPN